MLITTLLKSATKTSIIRSLTHQQRNHQSNQAKIAQYHIGSSTQENTAKQNVETTLGGKTATTSTTQCDTQHCTS